MNMDSFQDSVRDRIFVVLRIMVIQLMDSINSNIHSI